MSKLRTKSLKFVLIAVIGLVLVIAVLQWRAEFMVKDFLNRKLPKHLSLSYDDLNINIIKGNIYFENLSLEISNRDSISIHSSFKAKSLHIEDFGYTQFFFNNTIDIELFELQEPDLSYYPYKYTPAKKSKKQGVVNLLKTIIIRRIALNQGSLLVMKDTKDSIALALKNYDFELLGGKTDPELITHKIPISYTDYSFHGNDIFADLGQYERLIVKEVETSENTLQVRDITLTSKYDKQELSKHISIERDYVLLIVPEVAINDFDFGFEGDRFGVTVASSKMSDPSLELYRDKRQNDDNSRKTLFSKLLRELPINLIVERFEISNGYVSYEEKMSDKSKAGRLIFENLNADISKISNIGGPDLFTEVKTSSNVMGNGELQLNWSFNVSDQTDAFVASGSLRNLLAENLNSFLEPNLRTRAKGTIDEMYFTFHGDSKKSKGDLKMKYHDFKFQILDKDRLGINKFLSHIGNLFINDGSQTDVEGFRHGKIDVERAADKSFFNYLWLNLQDGMVSTLTCNGKKDD